MRLYVFVFLLVLAYRAYQSPIIRVAFDFTDSNPDLSQADGALGLFIQILEFLSLHQDHSATERHEVEKIERQREEFTLLVKAFGHRFAPTPVKDCWHGVTCVSRNFSIPSVEGVSRRIPALLIQSKTKPVGLRRPIIYYHSGGGVIGDAYNVPVAYGIVAALDAVVISVDYRLAPENPYPAGVDDSFEAVNWCIENCAQLGADLSLLTLAGESAGGLMTAAVAQRWKDLKRPEKIHQLIMVVPMLGPVLGRTFVKYENIHLLPMRQMGYFWDMYTQNVYDCVVDPICSPVSAAVNRLEGIAEKALIVPGRADVLYSEGIEYARKLKLAGVDTAVHELRNSHLGALIFDQLVSSGKLKELLV